MHGTVGRQSRCRAGDRFTPLLAIGGLVMLPAAAALLAGLNPETAHGDVLVAASSRLIGLGVGASASPALFITGFSLRWAQGYPLFHSLACPQL